MLNLKKISSHFNFIAFDSDFSSLNIMNIGIKLTTLENPSNEESKEMELYDKDFYFVMIFLKLDGF